MALLWALFNGWSWKCYPKATQDGIKNIFVLMDTRKSQRPTFCKYLWFVHVWKLSKKIVQNNVSRDKVGPPPVMWKQQCISPIPLNPVLQNSTQTTSGRLIWSKEVPVLTTTDLTLKAIFKYWTSWCLFSRGSVSLPMFSHGLEPLIQPLTRLLYQRDSKTPDFKEHSSSGCLYLRSVC